MTTTHTVTSQKYLNFQYKFKIYFFHPSLIFCNPWIPIKAIIIIPAKRCKACLSVIPSKEVPVDKTSWKIIASCSIEIFRFLAISIVELKNTHFRRVLPVFWAFPVQGPIIIASRTIVREVMMGPRTGNAQKTGKTEAEMGILKLNNRNVRNLKISMLHIVLWHFFHIGPKPVF